LRTRNKRADNQAKPKNRACVYYGMNEIQKKLYSLSKNDHKFYNLYQSIQSKDNILMAYRCVKNNKGANTPGVDRITKKQVARLGADKLIKMVQKKVRKLQTSSHKKKIYTQEKWQTQTARHSNIYRKSNRTGNKTDTRTNTRS